MTSGEVDQSAPAGLQEQAAELRDLNQKSIAAHLNRAKRGGRTRAKVITDRTLDAIHGEIHGGVEVGSQLYTDDHMAFNDLDGLFYKHDTVNHSAGEYARGAALQRKAKGSHVYNSPKKRVEQHVCPLTAHA